MKIPTRRSVNPQLDADLNLDAKLLSEINWRYAEARKIEATNLTDDRKSRAQVLLGDKPATESSGGMETLKQLGKEIGDRKAARELLGARIEIEGSKASAIVCQQVSPLLKQAHVALCESLISACAANKQYQNIIDPLEADSVLIGSLYPLSPNAILQDHRDQYSHVAIFLRSAVAQGIISASKLPVEFRL